MPKKIAIIYGTRPEYLKLKKIIQLVPKNKREVIFTGQHDELVSNYIFTNKINIGKISNQRLNNIFSDVIRKLNLSNYSAIIIQGDTATTCAAAINAFNNKIKIIYVESGLRSYDYENPYPEECYRQIISRLAHINFSPTNLSRSNLKKEKIKSKIFVVGNTALDNLLKYKKNTKYTDLVPITLHRRENLNILLEWFEALNKVAKNFNKLKFIYPIHANPVIKKKIKVLKNIKIVNAVSHEKMINYISKSKFIITDSGGIQEEGSFLNKKVIVCRKVTERPEGIKSGHLKICSKPSRLFKMVKLLNNNYKIKNICPYGDGKSSLRIIKILKREGII